MSTTDANEELASAARKGDLDAVKDCIEKKGASINSRTSYGRSYFGPWYQDYSALDYAADRGYYDIVDYLINEKGADVNDVCKHGFTPLHLACSFDEGAHYECFNGSLEVAELLLDNGADINATTDQGETPLEMALRWKQWSIVEHLLERDANVSDDALEKFVFDDIQEGGIEGVKLLLRKGGDINKPVNDDETLLYVAVEGRKYDATRFLLEHGANVHHKDGKSPFLLAFEKDDLYAIFLMVRLRPELWIFLSKLKMGRGCEIKGGDSSNCQKRKIKSVNVPDRETSGSDNHFTFECPSDSEEIPYKKRKPDNNLFGSDKESSESSEKSYCRDTEDSGDENIDGFDARVDKLFGSDEEPSKSSEKNNKHNTAVDNLFWSDEDSTEGSEKYKSHYTKGFGNKNINESEDSSSEDSSLIAPWREHALKTSI